MKKSYPDAVVLLPGFMGFGRMGDFYYFADRVAAALRGALEARLGRVVPVLGFATRPIGSLASRQAYLLTRLAAVDRTLGGVERFHLVGHSAGGLDADLLRSRSPLDGRGWSALDPGGVRQRLASVVTIASPHYGTCLAESPSVQFLRTPSANPAAWLELARLLGELAKVVVHRPLIHEAISASLTHSSGAGQFIWQLLTDQELLGDLVPARVEEIRREHPPALEVPVSCFVVAAPDAKEEAERKPDHFFDLLYALTSQSASEPSEPVRRTLDALRRSTQQIVKSPVAQVPDWAAATSDGVVNSARQVVQAEGAELAAIVIADHADVLGHYDRCDPLTDGSQLNQGLFRSGSGFGDDEFFRLYGLVAQAVSNAARG